MNLKEEIINEELWNAIKNSYNAENYSHAINDGIRFIFDVIRERTYLDDDGINLIGKVFNKENPLLKINRLQNQSEKDEQKGHMLLLQGIYSGIRNPRSHELSKDDKRTADAITIFLDYLLTKIEGANEPYVVENFVSERILDKHFVEDTEFTIKLVDEIPKKKLLDTLIEIYRRKSDGAGIKIRYPIMEIISRLSIEDKIEFLNIVSEELKIEDDISILIQNLIILPEYLWVEIDDIACMRIENIIIDGINNGKMTNLTNLTIYGILGTWTLKFVQHFRLKSKLLGTLLKNINKIETESEYIAKYYLDKLPILAETDSQRFACLYDISDGLGSNPFLQKHLINHFNAWPKKWREEFLELNSDIRDEHEEFFDQLLKHDPF